MKKTNEDILNFGKEIDKIKEEVSNSSEKIENLKQEKVEKKIIS